MRKKPRVSPGSGVYSKDRLRRAEGHGDGGERLEHVLRVVDAEIDRGILLEREPEGTAVFCKSERKIRAARVRRREQ